MSLIPNDVVEAVRQNNDIFTVVSDYLRLKKQGRNYVGLCPFHNEKTPSFSVNTDKQMYYCFGCGAGGNVISFIMQIEGFNFPEAVKFLADKAGIHIPESETEEDRQQLREREKAAKLNQLVKDFFHYILLKHESADEAREYLKNRGINKETLEKFQLGFAPDAWDGLISFLLKKGYQPDYLEQQGLVLKKNSGNGYYDRFRNRIIFPIWDNKNNVIGFGGRVLDDSLPKYLNSPETILFNKSTNLYGINFAIPAVREADHIIIVEGYLDVITCHQYGIKNVVASLGTALTKEQGKILARYAQKVYIAYDADNAGVAATLRGLEILQDTGCRVKVVNIPDGKDPDELIRNKGPDSFTGLIRENAKSLIEYKLEKAMEKFDYDTIEGKIRIVSELIPNIIKIQSEIEREEQIRFISEKLSISNNALWVEIKKYWQKNRKNMAHWDKITSERDNKTEFKTVIQNTAQSRGFFAQGGTGKSAYHNAEENLIKLLLAYPDLWPRVVEELGMNFTEKPEYVCIIKHMTQAELNNHNCEPADVINNITDETLRQKVSSLMVQSEPPGNPESLLKDFVKVIKDEKNRRKREDLLKRIEQAEQENDKELSDQLLKEYAKLI